jgi:hypothetical protein
MAVITVCDRCGKEAKGDLSKTKVLGEETDCVVAFEITNEDDLCQKCLRAIMAKGAKGAHDELKVKRNG